MATLRDKLIERYPALYVPNLNRNKSITMSKELLMELRTHYLNHFFYSISKIPYLSNSDEVAIFISNTKEPLKSLEKLEKRTLTELQEIYEKEFPNMPEDYDINSGKTKIAEFQKLIKNSINHVRNLRKVILESNEVKNNEFKSYCAFINYLVPYEKSTVFELSEQDQSTTMFANENKQDLKEKAGKLGENLKNPMLEFIWFLEDQEIDLEGYDEAILRFYEVESNIDKLNKRIQAANEEIKKIQTGQKTFFGIGKTKEIRTQELEKESKECTLRVQIILKLVKLVAFHYESVLADFKKENRENYYQQLKKLAEVLNNNEKYNSEMWNIVKEGVVKYKQSNK